MNINLTVFYKCTQQNIDERKVIGRVDPLIALIFSVQQERFHIISNAYALH